MNMRSRIVSILLTLLLPLSVLGQDEQVLAPVTRTYAITNVNIVQAPGRKIDMGTIIIKDGLIRAVGKGIAIPADAIVVKADSMYAYAGFIDGLTRAGVNKPKEENRDRVKDPGNPTPERAGITPWNDVRFSLNPSDKGLEEIRNLGFTTAQVVPYGNLFPGQAAVILSGGKGADDMVLIGKSSLYSELTGANNVYPATLLGVMAKWRELYRQAAISKSYEAMYASNRSGLERPVSDRNLEALYPVVDQRMPVIFKSERLLDVNHVLTLKKDLGFSAVLADVKDAWPIINTIKASGAKTFLSIDLPEEVKKDEKKDKKDEGLNAAAKAENEGLEKRKAEAVQQYAAQAAAFQKAGVVFGFSTMSAKTKDIPANLRRMIAAGLTEDAALAALTTNPAQLLGLSDRLGTIDNGKMANLVISDKSYFNEKAKVRYVFVDGVMFKMDVKETKKGDPNAKVDIEGTWSTVTETQQGRADGKLTFKKDGSNYSGKISGGRLPSPIDLTDVSLDGNVLTFKYSMTFGSNTIAVSGEVTVDGDSFKGTVSFGQNRTAPIEGTKDPKN
ncbi:MAG: amidohydrolase family protein [Cyclobacteriaceae bacterium]|nr:amidohydrolase family protein [Cyclobacteriaceae bacterium]